MATIFTRWLYPIATKPPVAHFRAKLSDDPDVDGVELAGFSTPTATELDLLDNKHFDSYHSNGAATSALDTEIDHLLVEHYSDSSKPLHPLAASHANAEGRYPDTGDTLSVNSLQDTDGTASVFPASRHLAYRNSVQQDTQQHWHKAASDVRLVISVLLEVAADQHAAAKLDQLLTSSTWEEACKHCRDGLLMLAILQHYFPDSVDLNSSDNSAHDPSSNKDSSSAAAGPTDCNTISDSSSRSSTHRVGQGVNGCVLDSAPSAAAGHAEQQYFQDPLRQSQPPLNQWQQSEQEHASSDSDPQQQEQQWRQYISKCLSAAAAAGISMTFKECDVSSMATLQPDLLLQLLLAVVVAGEAQQQLQGQCLTVLQQVQEQLAAQVIPQYPHLQGGTASSAGDGRGRCQAAAGCGQTGVLQGSQMNKQQLGLNNATVWGLIKAWIAVVVHQSGDMQQRQPGDRNTALVQQQEQYEQQMQESDEHSSTELCIVASVTWHSLVEALHRLQRNVDAVSQQQQQHQQQQQRSAAAGSVAGSAQQHPSGKIMQSASNSSRISNGRTDTGKRSGLLQQLQELGCNLAFLHQEDLADPVLQGQVCPDELRLVVLLRLLGHTSSLWLPTAVAASTPANVPNGKAAGSWDAASEHTLQLERQQSTGFGVHHEDPSRTASPTAAHDSMQLSGDECNIENDGVITSPRSLWPPELLTQSQLWPGDENEEDAAAMSREERTLRCWINSLLHKSERGSSSAGGSATPGSTGVSVGRRSTGDASSTAAGGTARSAGKAAVLGGINGAACRVGTSVSSAEAALHSVGQQDKKLTLAETHRSTIPSTTPADADATTSPYHFSFRSISSLFGAEVRSGVLLLELLEYLQPQCVDWKLANKLPFRGVGMSAQLQALENCQLALRIAQEDLGLPLVSMSPKDVVLGRRKIILSLVYQLMRFHTMQLLEGIAAVQHQRQQRSGGGASSEGGGQQGADASSAAQLAGLGSAGGRSAAGSPEESPSVTPRAAGFVRICSGSSKQRKGRQLGITEDAILAWANARLQQVQPSLDDDPTGSHVADCSDVGSRRLSEIDMCKMVAGQAAVAAPCIKSFRDPVLSSGVVLLQLLYAMKPDAVDLGYVTPGFTLEQRQSNAKYALSVADRMGCSLFLVWEDLVDLQPNLVLVLLASLMYLDHTMG